MPLGGNDVNGIYLYGEDDPISAPSFSGLLNRLGSSVSAAVAALLTPAAAVPAFTAGWTNTGGTTSLVKVGKIVTLNLRATRNAALTAGAIPVTLPVGYRPVSTIAGTGYASGAGNPLFTALEIDNAGVLRVYPTAGTTEVNFSGFVSFRVP